MISTTSFGVGSGAFAGYGMNSSFGMLNTNAGNVGYCNTAAPTSNGYVGNLNSTVGKSNVATLPSDSKSASGVAAPEATNSPTLDLPTRTWSLDGGDVVYDAQYVGMLDGNVVVRKSSGHISLVSFDRLSDADRQFITSVAGQKALTASAVASDSP